MRLSRVCRSPFPDPVSAQVSLDRVKQETLKLIHCSSHANVHSSSRPHYCPVKHCSRSEGGRGFKRKNEMIRHGLVHQSPGYICPFCPEREHRYPRPDNLQRYTSQKASSFFFEPPNLLKDTSEYTMWTKTRTTLCCARFSHRELMVATGADEGEQTPEHIAMAPSAFFGNCFYVIVSFAARSWQSPMGAARRVTPTHDSVVAIF